MDGSTLGIIEMTLSAVLVLGFCAYQVWKMDREIKKDKIKAKAKANIKANPNSAEQERAQADTDSPPANI